MCKCVSNTGISHNSPENYGSDHTSLIDLTVEITQCSAELIFEKLFNRWGELTDLLVSLAIAASFNKSHYLCFLSSDEM